MRGQTRVRICTYNIFHGDRTKEDPGVIGRALREAGAEIVGLQEVDIGTERMQGQDVLRAVAEAGGYPYYAFCHAIDLGSGEYGTAVLSLYPIRSFTVTPLPSDGEEERSLGHAVIELEDGETIDFFNTHVSYLGAKERKEQLALVAKEIRVCERYLLTGDFNTEDESELSVFEGSETLNPRVFPTYYPRSIAIDHIFVPAGTRAEGAQMPVWEYSDHYPLLADVYL